MSGTALQGERRSEARVKAEPGVVEFPQVGNGMRGDAVMDQVGLSLLDVRDEQDRKPVPQLLYGGVLGLSEALFAPGGSSLGDPNQVLVKVEESWDE